MLGKPDCRCDSGSVTMYFLCDALQLGLRLRQKGIFQLYLGLLAKRSHKQRPKHPPRSPHTATVQGSIDQQSEFNVEIIRRRKRIGELVTGYCDHLSDQMPSCLLSEA